MAELPLGIVRACLRMLPVLSAEESLLAAERIAVGTGSLKKDAARAVVRGWTDASGASRRQRTKRRKATMTPHLLAQMGIGVRLVEKAS